VDPWTYGIYGIFCRDFIKYGVYIRFWPTQLICIPKQQSLRNANHGTRVKLAVALTSVNARACAI